jgi:hypothetical protein
MSLKLNLIEHFIMRNKPTILNQSNIEETRKCCKHCLEFQEKKDERKEEKHVSESKQKDKHDYFLKAQWENIMPITKLILKFCFPRA